MVPIISLFLSIYLLADLHELHVICPSLNTTTPSSPPSIIYLMTYIHLSVCPSLSVYLSIYLSVCLSARLSLSVCLSDDIPTRQSAADTVMVPFLPSQSPRYPDAKAPTPAKKFITDITTSCKRKKQQSERGDRKRETEMLRREKEREVERA